MYPLKNIALIALAAVTMRRTKNISHLAAELNVARPTATSLLATAEKIAGGALFERSRGTFNTTETGEAFTSAASELLRSARAFETPDAVRLSGLAYLRHVDDGEASIAQQYPFNDVWNQGSSELRTAINVWCESKGEVESDAFAAIRDRLLLMRNIKDEWVFIEIGPKSALFDWIGSVFAQSAIGRPVNSSYLDRAADRYLVPPLDHLLTFGGVWYDHVSTMLPRPGTNDRTRYNYQRVLMRCSLPDGSPILASYVSRTDQIQILGLDQAA